MSKKFKTIGKSKGESKTKIKVISSKEARRIVEKNGWILNRRSCGGGHYYYKNPHYFKTLVIPEKLNRMIWERCVKEFEINLNVQE